MAVRRENLSMSIFTNSAARSIEEASEYTSALLALLGDRDPLEVLPTTPPAIRKLVAGASAEELRTPEADGKWSIGMVAQHLADSELVWGWRLRMVLAHDRPTITGYDQDAWATRLRYNEAVIDDSLGDFEHQRRSNLRLLSTMPETDRSRVGVHAERGEESVAHMMRLYAGHDLLHIRQIERIKKELGVRS
jgi:hypothetical protein